jgi:hypothetical protein
VALNEGGVYARAFSEKLQEALEVAHRVRKAGVLAGFTTLFDTNVDDEALTITLYDGSCGSAGEPKPAREEDFEAVELPDEIAVAAYVDFARLDDVYDCLAEEERTTGFQDGASGGLYEFLSEVRYPPAEEATRAIMWLTPSGPGLRGALYLDPEG